MDDPEGDPPPRYRQSAGSLDDSLQQEVRNLTNDITEARRQLQRELPRRRRSDLRSPPPRGSEGSEG